MLPPYSESHFIEKNSKFKYGNCPICRYSPDGSDSVSFERFAQLMGLVFGGKDTEGFSSDVIRGNQDNVDAHVDNQRMKQMDITEKQINAAAVNAERIEQQLRSLSKLLCSGTSLRFIL